MSNLFAQLTGLIVLFLGFSIGLFFGGWLCLVGGITDLIKAVHPFSLGLFALGVLKIFVADLAFYLPLTGGIKLSDWLVKEKTDFPTTH